MHGMEYLQTKNKKSDFARSESKCWPAEDIFLDFSCSVGVVVAFFDSLSFEIRAALSVQGHRSRLFIF